MPEPEFEIIQDTCFGYHYANPNGIGVKVNTKADKDYDIDVTHIDLAKGEVTFKYTDLRYENYLDKVNQCINSIRSFTYIPLPFLPYPGSPVVTKEVNLLKNKDIVYLDVSGCGKNGVLDITDDARGVEYVASSNFRPSIVCNVNQDTGIDIFSEATSIDLVGKNKNIRLIDQNSLIVMWRSNEFPYKNMAVSKSKFINFQCQPPGVGALEAFNWQDGSLVILPHPAPLAPLISQTQQYLVKVNNDLSLGSYVSVNFNHSDTDFPGDQKHILVVSYDGDNTGKATPFFDLNSLSYKKGYIYRDVDLSKVQLDPQLVAKSKKITLYAFNGQTPFAGVGELAVK